MLSLLQLFGRFQGLTQDLKRLPGWARFLVGIVALPGILAMLLSILAFLVSLLALFVMTVPVYRLVCRLAGVPSSGSVSTSRWGSPPYAEGSPVAGPVVMPEGVAVTVEDSGVAPVLDPSALGARPRRQIDVKIVE